MVMTPIREGQGAVDLTANAKESREVQVRDVGDAENRRPKELILLVEDDKGDQLLTKEALVKSGLAERVIVLPDGEEALAYLRCQGKYQEPNKAPRPDLVLLDLNIPKVNGRKVAEEVKADSRLRAIPIVILSTSDSPEDVKHCYEAGVNSYVRKPIEFDEYVEAISAIEHYWLHVSESAVV